MRVGHVDEGIPNIALVLDTGCGEQERVHIRVHMFTKAAIADAQETGTTQGQEGGRRGREGEGGRGGGEGAGCEEIKDRIKGR